MTKAQLAERMAKFNFSPDFHKVGRGKYAGTICFKMGYYWHPPVATPESFAQKISEVLTACDLPHEVVNAEDHWNAWPKDSYYAVHVRLNEGA